ncbi:MAG: sigma-70 family RNA polymerase sigma factor [Flavobacteriales bacterium]|nr:sigma-70 family RNA polymerase sigma factor [Flavobacteriales bacterium]
MEDSELLSMFSDENSRNYAFNLIVKKYQQKIYWHIRRMVIDHDDANDVTQNTFIKAWKGLEAFKQEAQLYTWLYRIATNESINFLNKKRKVLLLPLIDVERELSNKLEADAYFSGNVIQKKLQKALLQLPEKQRIVFNLKYFEEMKYEDMSTILNTSVGALKASYHIAVKKIEEYLKSH